MITLNIVGDFFSPSLSGLRFGEELQQRLAEADVNIVNFEGPVKAGSASPIIKSGPNIAQDANAPEFLKNQKFNVFSLANNHSMDYGVESLKKTTNCFSDSTWVGAGNVNDAYRVKVVEVENQKIGFLALTQYEFGVLAEAGKPGDMGAAWMGHPVVDELIVKAKQECDYLIVLPHAGLEYFELPLPELRVLYRHFITMGADAVIAGHPHVPQPCDTYKGKPIAYSLGNFCFDEKCDKPLWRDGLLATLQIDGGEVRMHLSTVHFDAAARVVELSHDAALDKRLKVNQELMDDEQAYRKAVNARCLSMRSYYDMLMEMGGYNRLSFRRCLGYVKRSLTGKQPKPEASHFVNCMRCEPHRWVLSRIYELDNSNSK